MSPAAAVAEPEANAVRHRGLVDVRQVKNWPAAPAMIEELPVGLIAYPSLDALARRAADKLAGRRFTLSRGHGALPPFDAFPMLTIWAEIGPGKTPDWIGAAVLLGDIDADTAQLTAALDLAVAARATRTA